MANKQEIYYQTANRKYIEEQYGKTPWVQVSGHQSINDADAEYWCGLVDINSVDDTLKDCG